MGIKRCLGKEKNTHRMASHIQKAFQTANLSGFFSSGSTNATLTSESPNLFAMLPLLFTSSAIRDWAKLIVIGGIFETCRRFASNSYSDLLSSFRIEAVFDDDDPTYGKLIDVDVEDAYSCCIQDGC